MKTVAKDDKILRLSDLDAEVKVRAGWKFIPKSEWKSKVRDVNKEEKSTTEKIKKEKKQKKV